MINVAVYGTLKRGYGNHGLLRTAQFLGHGVTKNKLRMFDTGGFPVVFHGEQASGSAVSKSLPEGLAIAPITVEAYGVDTDTLIALDRLEWNGRMFVRTKHDIIIGSHSSCIECSMYLGVEDFWKQRLPSCAEVPVISDRLCWPVQHTGKDASL